MANNVALLAQVYATCLLAAITEGERGDGERLALADHFFVICLEEAEKAEDMLRRKLSRR